MLHWAEGSKERNSVLLCNSERDPARERQYVDELVSDGIRGIVLCSSLPSLEHVSGLIEDGLLEDAVIFAATPRAVSRVVVWSGAMGI